MEKSKKEFIEEDFEFYIPIAKAISTREIPDSNLRWIEGIASTEDKDLQGETVDQRGIDFSYALNHGYFNDDHKPGAKYKLGEITEIEVKSVKTPSGQKQHGLYVKGFLYNNKDESDEYWKLLRAQESTPGSKRRIGFSIQGKVKKRFGNKILSCWVQDIAITCAPINTNTWASIVKSLMLEANWCKCKSGSCTGCTNGCGISKTLDAGYATTAQTGGSALRVQSLDSDIKNQKFRISKNELSKMLKSSGKFPDSSVDKFLDLMEMMQEMGI